MLRDRYNRTGQAETTRTLALSQRPGVKPPAFPLGWVLAMVIAASPVAAVAADDDPPEEVVESGRVIVTEVGATIQIADKKPRPVETGTVLTYSRRNGPWLWIDSLWGWVEESSVKPLAEAETYYTRLIEEAREKKGDGSKDGKGGQDAEPQQVPVELHQRGIVRLSLGRPAEALEDFDASLEEGYKAANVHANRGRALLALDRFDDAMDAMTEAIAANPEAGGSYDARALALMEKEFFEAALTDADKAIELAPGHAMYWYNRGQIQRSLGQYEPAVKSFNEAIRLAPRFVEALTNRGFSLKRLGRIEQAAEDYRQAIEIDPQLSVAYNDLAWLLATTGDESLRSGEDAVELAERAVELLDADEAGDDATRGQYADTLAAAYAAAGQWEKAVEAGRRAVELLDGADQYAADQRLELYLKKEPYIGK